MEGEEQVFKSRQRLYNLQLETLRQQRALYSKKEVVLKLQRDETPPPEYALSVIDRYVYNVHNYVCDWS